MYYIPTDPRVSGTDVEDRYVEVLTAVKTTVKIPVAIKLSPFFSSMASMAQRLDNAGADGLVLFNRFYQPDLDIETLEAVADLKLSTSDDLRLPLRWVAILYGRLKTDLALTSGVHTAQDAIKSIMAGANVAMMASALIHNGPSHLTQMLAEMTEWLDTYEYESVTQMRGSMSQQSVAEPAAFERANYMKALTTYDNRLPF